MNAYEMFCHHKKSVCICNFFWYRIKESSSSQQETKKKIIAYITFMCYLASGRIFIVDFHTKLPIHNLIVTQTNSNNV